MFDRNTNRHRGKGQPSLMGHVSVTLLVDIYISEAGRWA